MEFGKRGSPLWKVPAWNGGRKRPIYWRAQGESPAEFAIRNLEKLLTNCMNIGLLNLFDKEELLFKRFRFLEFLELQNSNKFRSQCLVSRAGTVRVEASQSASTRMNRTPSNIVHHNGRLIKSPI